MVDLVYPASEARLVAEPRAHSFATVERLELLVDKGARSFELYTGPRVTLEAMRAAARQG